MQLKLQILIVSLIITVLVFILRIFAFLISKSLVILADTLHSLFDFLAGIIAVYAMTISLKPPDKEHTYGHTKAENIGGLLEAILLLSIVIFISYEAIERFFTGVFLIEFNIIVLSLMGITVLLDYWRYRVLEKYAKKYSSQILKGESLHFSSDMYATLTILAIISLGLFFPNTLIFIIDIIAAISLSLYFTFASLSLSKISLSELMDISPKGLIEEVNKIIESSGVKCKSIRARKISNKIFIDSTICLPSSEDVKSAHDITEIIENKVKEKYKEYEVDMIIHVEPLIDENFRERLFKVIKEFKDLKDIHNLIITKKNGKYNIRMHAEFDPNLSIKYASEISNKLKIKIKENFEEVNEVLIHIEPYKRKEIRDIRKIIEKEISKDKLLKEYIKLKSIKIIKIKEKYFLDVICKSSPNLTVEETHELVNKIELFLKEKLGEDTEITMHVET